MNRGSIVLGVVAVVLFAKASAPARAAEFPSCPPSVAVSEALTEVPPGGWSPRMLASKMSLSDVQFSSESPADGFEYRMTDDTPGANDTFRRLTLPASGSSTPSSFGFYYTFPPAQTVWVICRYLGTSVTLVRRVVGLQHCRVEHVRPSGSVKLEECE